MSEAEQTGGSVSKRLRNNFVTASSDVSGASLLDHKQTEGNVLLHG